MILPSSKIHNAAAAIESLVSGGPVTLLVKSEVGPLCEECLADYEQQQELPSIESPPKSGDGERIRHSSSHQN